MELLDEMIVFAKVVELRSFSEAARQLRLTGSAVSRSVSRLEAHLAGKLLHRTTRAVTPTELGLDVYRGCSLIARTAREVTAVAGRYARAPVGRLAVSAPVVFGERWLMPRVPDFLQRWPDVQLKVTLTDRVVDLVNDGVDVAVRISSELPGQLVARPLLQVSYLLVAAPAYLQRRGEPQSPGDLAQHECVILGHGDFGGNLVLGQGPHEAEVKISGRLEVDNGAAILRAAETGFGIGLLPDFAAADSLASGRVTRVLPQWSLMGGYRQRHVHLLYAPTRHLPQKVRAFIDHLVEAA